MTSTHANVAFSRAHATIMDRNHAARLFFSLAIEQPNEELGCCPHPISKSSSGHAILSGVLSMRGLVTTRQAFTRHMRTEPARAGPARCGGPGQHGSRLHDDYKPSWPGYKCSCKRGIRFIYWCRGVSII